MAVIEGHGTLLKLGDDTIAHRVTISGPTRQVGTAETTDLDSTAKTYRATLADNGEVSLECWFDPDDDSHIALEDLVNSPELATWSLVFPTATPTTYTFSGILTGFELSGMEVEGNLTASLTIKISGGITKS